MAREFDGSTQWLENSSPVLDAVPLTIAAWFKPDTVSGAQSIFCIGGDDGSAVHAFGIILVGDDFWAFTQAVTSNQAVVLDLLSADTWYHGCGVFADVGDRRAFINGGNKVTASVTRIPNTAHFERMRCGQRANDLNDQDFNGSIARLGVWDAALVDSEVATLATGVSVRKVRPQNLVIDLDMVRDDDEDIVGGLSFTAVASPTIDTHPPIILTPPESPWSFPGGVSAAAAVDWIAPFGNLKKRRFQTLLNR